VKSEKSWQLLVLSAKTATALETATTQLVEHFKQHPDLNLADVAYTYQVGRRAFEHRRMLVCQTVEDIHSALSQTGEPLSPPLLQMGEPLRPPLSQTNLYPQVG
jgi:acyl transferase domain-containing protein